MKYSILALLGQVAAQAELGQVAPKAANSNGLEFLEKREPSKSKVVIQKPDGTPTDLPKYSGLVGGQSKLVGEKEPTTDVANLPYGPFFQKKYEWEKKHHAEKPLEDTEPPAYKDAAGVWTGTLAQKSSSSHHRRGNYGNAKHHHKNMHHFDNNFLQTEAEGIPVYVNPESTLYPNVIEDMNFGQKFRIGLDDIDLVQTEEQGIPVHVNPESVLYPDTIAKQDFGFEFRLGNDEVKLLQTEEQGIPVHVNPESVLYPDTIAKQDFGFDFRLGNDEVKLLQTEEQGIPVHNNPESVLYPDTIAKQDFGLDFKVGLDDVKLIQTGYVDESLYNNQPAPYCSSSGWCGRPYGNKAPEVVKGPRIGAYDAEGKWVLPQGIANTTGVVVAPGDQQSVPCIKGIDTNIVRCTLSE